MPEQRNALDVILNNPQLIRELKLATQNQDDEQLLRVSLIAEPGVDPRFSGV